MNISWDRTTEAKFAQMIGKVPVFMREVARNAVLKKIEATLAREYRHEVTEKDMVDAFFAATPFGFHGPMKDDMKEFGIDYVQYGHPA